MTHAKYSLIRRYFITMLLVAILPVTIVGYLWIADARQSFKQFETVWQQSLMQKHEAALSQQVASVLSYITFRHSQIQETLRQELRYRVQEAMAMADALSDAGAGREAVLTALRKLQLHAQHGFYTVLSPEGKILLGQISPELEQSSLLAFYQGQEQQALKSAIAEVLDQGEVYLTIHGVSDERPNQELRLAFAQYHPQLNIIIINHNSLSAIAQQVRLEVLQRFGNNNSIADTSIFILDQQAQLLVAPDSLQGVTEISFSADEAPQPIIRLWQRLVTLLEQQPAQQQPFLSYQLRGASAENTVPVMSYAAIYDEWQWLVGAQILLGDYHQKLALQQQRFDDKISRYIVFVITVVALFILIVSVIAYSFYRMNNRGFKRFIQFFNRSCEHAEAIDVSELPCREFVELAFHANHMLAQRVSYEHDLQKSQRRFRLALKASNSYLWELDTARQQVKFSGRILTKLGYPQLPGPEKISIEQLLDLCHPDDKAVVESATLAQDKKMEVAGIEFRLKHADGDYHWFYSRGGVIDQQANEQVSLLAGIVTDISERKCLESDLQRANVVVAEASYAREQFLSSMSHELHTPLNNILGHLQILQRDPLMAKEQCQQLKSAEEAGNYLLRLVNDILELSKIDSGYMPVQVGECVLNELVQNIVDMVAQKAKDKGLQFVVNVDGRLPNKIRLDVVKLKQVLMNLLSNAIKYTQQGQVRMDVELASVQYAQQPELIFSISDTGIGIDKALCKKIFTPFTQLGGANTQGTGLGLAICWRLAQALEGRLRVDSELGKGSCFSLRLPLHAAGAAVVGAPLNISEHGDVVASAESTLMAFTGLSDKQHEKLCWAAKMGDIETLQALLRQLEKDGFGSSDWLLYCRQLLASFDVEKLLQFLHSRVEAKGSKTILT